VRKSKIILVWVRFSFRFKPLDSFPKNAYNLQSWNQQMLIVQKFLTGHGNKFFIRWVETEGSISVGALLFPCASFQLKKCLILFPKNIIY
jgi:hypothetical protein